MVNAPSIAKARDIAVTEVKRERRRRLPDADPARPWSPRSQTRTISGTLFNGDQPRIVEIKGMPMDAQLGPTCCWSPTATSRA